MTETPQVTLRVAGRSHVGRARERNEDSYFAGQTVFAVADGLGGHRAGEVASRLAIEPVRALERRSPEDAASGLGETVRDANRSIFERAQEDAALRGMGTTLTLLAVTDGTAHLAHVGDSRCYLLRGGQMTQLSHDHTLVARMQEEGKLTAEQAESHPQRSVLTRALGAEPEVEVEETRVSLTPGDRLLLCSDGLTTVVSDEEIREILTADSDLEAICKRLIDEANARGGPDNITVVVVELGGGEGRAPAAGGGGRLHLPHVPRRALLWTTLVLALLGGGLVWLRSWADHSYYVGVSGGHVAIYRGLPAEVFGIRIAKVEQVTPTELAQVPAFIRSRLEEGIRVPSLAEAWKKVQEIVSLSPAQPLPTPTPSPSASPLASPGRSP